VINGKPFWNGKIFRSLGIIISSFYCIIFIFLCSLAAEWKFMWQWLNKLWFMSAEQSPVLQFDTIWCRCFPLGPPRCKLSSEMGHQHVTRPHCSQASNEMRWDYKRRMFIMSVSSIPSYFLCIELAIPACVWPPYSVLSEHRDVVRTSVSYSEDPVFEFDLRELPLWASCGLPQSLQENTGMLLQNSSITLKMG
jgi:hypothetical protein